MIVVGIDLAGKPENITGFCALWTPSKENPLGRSLVKIIHTDEDIIREIENIKPDCIAIDAPFYLPRSGPWRECEIDLMKRGFRPLSPILPTMEVLTMRAKRLVKILNEKGFKTIEVFPRASESIWRISKEYGKNKDQYDALICALTAKSYLEGNFEDLHGLIIPK